MSMNMTKRTKYYSEPVLFISRCGASKVGLNIISKLPSHIKGFKVIGPLYINRDTGYYLYLIPSNDNEEPEPMDQYTFQMLQEVI